MMISTLVFIAGPPDRHLLSREWLCPGHDGDDDHGDDDVLVFRPPDRALLNRPRDLINLRRIFFLQTSSFRTAWAFHPCRFLLSFPCCLFRTWILVTPIIPLLYSNGCTLNDLVSQVSFQRACPCNKTFSTSQPFTLLNPFQVIQCVPKNVLIEQNHNQNWVLWG